MNSGGNNNNEKGVEVGIHDILATDAMSEFMKQGWAESPLTGITPHPSIAYTKARRDKLSKQYVGKRLIFPSGSLRVRSNDSDYQFKAHSAFSWFTGIVASDCVPDSLFVMEPTVSGHERIGNSKPQPPANDKG